MQQAITEDLRRPGKVELDERSLTTPSGIPVQCAVVFIDGDEYKWCEEVNGRLRNDQKIHNKWNKGVPGCTRVGKLGEVAIAKLFGLDVDFGFKASGDKFDFVICGMRVEVKTSFSNLGVGLVQCVGETGTSPEMKDVYIFAYLAGDSLCNGETAVVIVGWTTREELIGRQPQNAWRDGSWENLEIPHEELRPISELLERHLEGERHAG